MPRHRPAPARFFSFLTGLLALVLSTLSLACTQGACVQAGPRIAQVNSQQGLLLNAVTGGLLNSSLNLTVLDWQALATSDLNLDAYLNALSQQLSVSSPSQALAAQASLLSALQAAGSVAQADHNTSLVNALNALQLAIPAPSAPIRVGKLLSVTFPEGALTSTRINALNLVAGLVQLYNYDNVVTTPSPVSVNGDAAGLGSVIRGAQLWFQVVEPPIYTCGPQAATFHTAAMRVKLNLQLVNQNADTSALSAALKGALGAVQVSSSLSLTSVQAYVETARADGSIEFVDALVQSVTLRATPGVADLDLGRLPAALSFNRSHALPEADLDDAPVGTLSVQVTDALSGAPLAQGSAGVQLRGHARGQAPFASSASVSGPFPQMLVFSTSSTFVANLAQGLADNLQVRLDGSLGPVLDPLVNSTVLPALRPTVTQAVVPPLTAVLAGLVDPALALLGTGLGQAVFEVSGALQACASLSLDKQVRNVTRGTPFSTAESAGPGDTLEYCLAYRSTGAQDVTHLVLRDTLDGNTAPLSSVSAYGGGAMLLNGASLSATTDGDAGEYAGQALTVRVGTVPVGVGGRLCFQATVR